MEADALRTRLETHGQLVRWPDGVPGAFTEVVTDSRKAVPGSLFVAYAGVSNDGHAFIPAAVKAGAAAVIAERPVADVPVPVLEVKNGRRAAAIAAALRYGDPVERLKLIAVTGTNGKTTTVHLIRHILGAAAPASSLGTLGAIDTEGRKLPGTGSLTTPGPVELQQTLAALHEAGSRFVAMEASSHALDQDRLWGLRFSVGVFTNLTREHLDYHKTEDAYLSAKLKLVDYLEPGGWTAVNADDPAWRSLENRERSVRFGIETAAEVRATAIEGDRLGMRFTIQARGESLSASIPLPGRYNVANALGAAAAALALGLELRAVVDRLATAPQVPGRMERLAEEPCVVLRDYAHTPDGMERALAAVRALTPGRLILVFGCGGDRDRGKRPIMGAIAARDADLTILTCDNPRTESLDRIMDDIEMGMGETPHLRIDDRADAIARAIAIARPEDVVLLAGKGHEDYQLIGTEKLHFDEREVVAEVVARRR
ncbi:MAG TPA: UDP-N-acetylmuramoyl-L-alanyl-D-glutamate--2,6-diaminopimelate ligase [Gemmatimonadales bacterium]|nr:UDP-N-acetylmuramoyl-L-alanyl-D-glutamate--2,6-diaminopimelate ligase [Gemmatimonadales bacterium]